MERIGEIIGALLTLLFFLGFIASIILGVYLFGKGDVTNGLLAFILSSVACMTAIIFLGLRLQHKRR